MWLHYKETLTSISQLVHHPKECSSSQNYKMTFFILRNKNAIFVWCTVFFENSRFLKPQSIVSQIGRSVKRQITWIICPFTDSMLFHRFLGHDNIPTYSLTCACVLNENSQDTRTYRLRLYISKSYQTKVLILSRTLEPNQTGPGNNA